MLLSAEKVMETYASHRAVLELEYFGEVGTGLGPTLEFYTLLSHELQRKGLGMWRSDTGKDSEAAAAQGNQKGLACHRIQGATHACGHGRLARVGPIAAIEVWVSQVCKAHTRHSSRGIVQAANQHPDQPEVQQLVDLLIMFVTCFHAPLEMLEFSSAVVCVLYYQEGWSQYHAAAVRQMSLRCAWVIVLWLVMLWLVILRIVL